MRTSFRNNTPKAVVSNQMQRANYGRGDMWNVTDAMACAALLDIKGEVYTFEQACLKIAAKLRHSNGGEVIKSDTFFPIQNICNRPINGHASWFDGIDGEDDWGEIPLSDIDFVGEMLLFSSEPVFNSLTPTDSDYLDITYGGPFRFKMPRRVRLLKPLCVGDGFQLVTIQNGVLLYMLLLFLLAYSTVFMLRTYGDTEGVSVMIAIGFLLLSHGVLGIPDLWFAQGKLTVCGRSEKLESVLFYKCLWEICIVVYLALISTTLASEGYAATGGPYVLIGYGILYLWTLFVTDKTNSNALYNAPDVPAWNTCCACLNDALAWVGTFRFLCPLMLGGSLLDHGSRSSKMTLAYRRKYDSLSSVRSGGGGSSSSDPHESFNRRRRIV
jgi:hypothetical protein